jgi:ectoine hydroxylase-related dioxygenase (phytanoyl-CoA dioxygenase family)
MDVAAKPRPTQSTLRRVEQQLTDVSDADLSAAQCRVAAAMAGRPAFARRIAVLLDDGRGFLVDGPRRAVEALGARADAVFQIGPRDLDRILRGAMDPRQGVLFGQIRTKEGPVRAVIEFCDWLVGRVVSQRLETNAVLPAPTKDWRKAREDLEAFGYALVEGALSAEALDTIRTRIVEQAQGEVDAGVATRGEATQTVWALLNKGRVFHDVLLHPLIEAFVPELLGEHFILTGVVSQIAMPGNTSSTMHLDQAQVQPAVPQFPIGLNILWFLDDVSEANGGTRVMPGSHKGGIAPADPYDIEGTVAAQGPAGTALLLDSRVWHSVGHNVTDASRHLLVTYFNRAFMRAQENYFLSLRPGLLETFDERVKIMLGYRCTGSLGAVEGPVEGKMNGRPANPVGELRPSTPVSG